MNSIVSHADEESYAMADLEALKQKYAPVI
jgi:hypothetical protein